MDPLTHMLAGAAVADALGAPVRLGRAALPFAMLLAAAPDLDMVPALVAAFPSNPFSASLFDADLMRRLHRGYTHALPVLAAASVVLGAMAWRWSGRREGSFAKWLALGLAAFLSHILLDMANGVVQLWQPFSSVRVGWGEFPEGDPLLILILASILMANHPFVFPKQYRFGTLTALERISAGVHRLLRSRLGARQLALIGLGCVALLLWARIAFA